MPRERLMSSTNVAEALQGFLAAVGNGLKDVLQVAVFWVLVKDQEANAAQVLLDFNQPGSSQRVVHIGSRVMARSSAGNGDIRSRGSGERSVEVQVRTVGEGFCFYVESERKSE